MPRTFRVSSVLVPVLLPILLPVLALLAAAPRASGEEGSLRPPEAFAGITDRAERSAALFTETSKVLTHPRCINCHPAGDVPLQGEDGRVHEPPVDRGRGGLGPVGMQCNTCHGRENFDPGQVPGAPAWHLAPPAMAWEGLSIGELCAQLKDPERTGGRDLEAVGRHMAEDELVAWGWEPGEGREPAPGSRKILAALIRAWIETGAACP